MGSGQGMALDGNRPPVAPPSTTRSDFCVYLGTQNAKSPCSELASWPYENVSSCHCRRRREKLQWPRAPRAPFATILKILCMRIRAMGTLLVGGRQKANRRYLMSRYMRFLRFNVFHSSLLVVVSADSMIDETHKGAER
jgi:hypothetical protein